MKREEGFSDVEKREGSGSSKSQTPIERKGLVMERIERTAADLRMARKKGQDWIWMRQMSV
jgi:hypothetical protein